jgi:hypothetical protein
MVQAGAKARNASVSKTEAVRQALSRLGNDASPTDIQSFVKRSFHMDMSTSHVSNCKSMILREASGKNVARAKGESESAKTESISKAEAVRQALARLGYDAKPAAILKYIRKKFHLAMNSNTVSTYKATETKKASGSSAILGKPASGSGDFSLEDLRAVKELTDRFGADKLKELADFLGR